MATNFWTKLAMNAYKCISSRDNENAITYNRGFSVVDQSKEDISDCIGLRDVARATNFGTKIVITGCSSLKYSDHHDKMPARSPSEGTKVTSQVV